MAAEEQELIDSYISRPGVTSDTEFLTGQLDLVLAKFNELNALKLKLNIDNSWKEVAATTDQVKKSTDTLVSSMITYGQVQNQVAQGTGALKTALASANDGISKVAQSLAAAKLQVQANSDAQKELKKQFDDGAISEQKYLEASGQLLQKQKDLQVTTAALNKELKASSQISLAPEGSRDQLRGLNTKLNSQAGQVNIVDPTADEAAKLQQVNALLDTSNGLIKKNADAYLAQKINIGNYSGAFQEAFQVLKEQLAATNTQLGAIEQKGKTLVNDLTGGNPIGFDPNRFKGQVTSLANAGGGSSIVSPQDAAVYQELTNKAQLLESTVERLSIGFKSTRQEARAFQEAAVSLGLTVGQEDENFLKFNSAVGSSINEINDLKAATKFQAQDAKIIVGLADAAATLTAGFAAAQAAEQLFGTENKDLQKQMANLQALLLLINSLQQIANGLQEESAGIQLLLAARVKLTALAEAAKQAIMSKSVVVNQAETATEVENAAAKEANVAVTGELVVAEGAQTVAVTENTVATEANAAAQGQAAVASKGFGAALGTGGVAGLSLAAGIGLALLTAKLIGFGENTRLTIEEQKGLAEATKAVIDTLDQQAKIFDTLDSSQKRYYSNAIANAQAAGANQYQLLLLQQRSDKAQADAAQNEINRLDATDANYEKTAHDLQILLDRQQAYNEELKQLNSIKNPSSLQTDLIEDTKGRLGVLSTAISTIQKTFDDQTAARSKLLEFNQKADEAETKLNKLALDDQLKDLEQAETLKANIIKARNALVLSDDRSTEQQRLNALKSSFTQEQNIRNAQEATIRKTPGNTNAGTLTPDAKRQVNALNEQRKEGEIKLGNDLENIRIAFNNRRIAAEEQLNAALLQSDSKTQQAIFENELKGLDDRLDAYKKYVADQKALEDNAFVAQLATAGFSPEEIQKIEAGQKVQVEGKRITNEELEALETEHSTRMQDITADSGKKIYDITASYAARQEKLANDENKANFSGQAESQYNAQLQALNDSFTKGLISAQAYEIKRTQIEQQGTVNRLKAAINEDDEKLKNLEGVRQDLLDEEFSTQQALQQATATNNQGEIDANKEKLQALYDAEVKNAGDIATVRQKSSKDQIALTEATVKTLLEQKQFEAQEEQRFQEAATSLIKNLLDAQYENKINQINAEITAVQDRAAAEVKAEQQSGDSAADQADKIANINARAAQQEAQLQKQANLEKRKEAEVDRVISLAKIAQNTAVAVTKAVAEFPLTAGEPWAAIAIAIGLIEAAAVLAAPLPAYKYGTGDTPHPGGWAKVGDGGKSELLEFSDGSLAVTPARDTYMNLPADTHVYPDAMETLREMQYAGFRQQAAYLPGMDRGGYDRQIAAEFRASTRQMVKAINDKHELHIAPGFNSIMLVHQYGASYKKWVGNHLHHRH